MSDPDVISVETDPSLSPQRRKEIAELYASGFFDDAPPGSPQASKRWLDKGSDMVLVPVGVPFHELTPNQQAAVEAGAHMDQVIAESDKKIAAKIADEMDKLGGEEAWEEAVFEAGGHEKWVNMIADMGGIDAYVTQRQAKKKKRVRR